MPFLIPVGYKRLICSTEEPSVQQLEDYKTWLIAELTTCTEAIKARKERDGWTPKSPPDKPIEACGMSIRAQNKLIEKGVIRLSQLLSLSEGDLSQRVVGRTVIQQIREWLATQGLTLRGDPPIPPASSSPTPPAAS